MENDIYTRLRERIDQYSIGMNPSGSGREIDILRRLFSVEEASVYLAMSRRLEPVRPIAGRAGLSEAEAARILA
ncbi:MAG TPA: 4Fe-4S ferredoxin, partial [Deltaproteobacteria bacterium]|nr:4Fe-4S ferredoxin [Deltaproteobacteria bacterium]